jgi:hypothetical protein
MQNDCEPTLYRLISHGKGSKKNDTAIVIPSADSIQILETHLRILADQDYKKFDVIIIGKAPDSVPHGLNLILYDEIYPLGSSGGFGLGQVLAYLLGYEYVINSDVDATPISKNLVRQLIKTSESSGKAVFPLSVPYEGGPIGGYVINQYGICPRSILEDFGFLYFQLFKGSEDVDYCERLAMENRVIYDSSILVKHKSHLFDSISLLKSRGNKYIYYKKSEMLVQILLASYSIRHFRLINAVKHFSAAFLSALKTQIFYSQYYDIWYPVICQAMHLDMSKASISRTSTILEAQVIGKPVRLFVFGETGASGVAFASGNNTLSDLVPSVKALVSHGEYFLLSERFLQERGDLLPVLLLSKPIKYSDGKIYSSGISHCQVATNLVKTMISAPYFLFSIAISVLKAFRLDYPITTKNLKKNLSLFEEYTKMLTAEKTQM